MNACSIWKSQFSQSWQDCFWRFLQLIGVVENSWSYFHEWLKIHFMPKSLWWQPIACVAVIVKLLCLSRSPPLADNYYPLFIMYVYCSLCNVLLCEANVYLIIGVDASSNKRNIISSSKNHEWQTYVHLLLIHMIISILIVEMFCHYFTHICYFSIKLVSKAQNDCGWSAVH